jgi:hypothetical protein
VPTSAQSGTKDTCGDGVCDETEQADPELCPQDCAQPPSEGDDAQSEEPSRAGETWAGEVVWGCDLEHASGTDTWTADLEYEFTVGADGTLAGQGSGTFRRAECTRGNCRCWIEPGPIALEVSGLQQGAYFYIKLDPEYDLTYCTQCPGVDVLCGSGIRQLEWCHCSAAGGPLEVNIEAVDNQARMFECNPRTDGAIGLNSAWTEGWTIITLVR